MATEALNLTSAEDKDALEGETLERVKRWIMEVTLAEKEQEGWVSRGNRIVKRYKDERGRSLHDEFGRDSITRYNILWSNVNTLLPSTFARTPKPQVQRRYRDSDPVGRTAATLLERAATYAVDAYDFDETMRNCVLDLLIVGRGQAWIKYIPYFQADIKKVPVTLDEETQTFFDPQGNIVEESKVREEENGKLFIEADDADEQVIYEEVKCDYVYWENFLHNPARTWDEVLNGGWVARKMLMAKHELRDRFGARLAEQIPLDHSLKGQGFDADELGPDNDAFKKATIYEIWDKAERKVYWLSKGVKTQFLDEEEDPLGLTDFFPCPKPLFATKTTDSLIPVADFSMYQDQAIELDELSSRITLLVRALRVAGVYDASFNGIQRVLQEGADNQLVPIPDWPSFQQRGGFQGVMQFMPLQEVAQTLQVLYQARDAIIQDIFQVTGISDIIRGATSPSETATAQQLKGQFATLRLADKQREVQRFARDLIAIKGEIIAEQFAPETIRIMTGTDFIDDPNVEQTFEEAIDLLRNDVLRQFRIDIETDSTLAIDEALEKEKRTEFVGTVGRFLSNTLETIQAVPEMTPLMAQSLMYLMRGFKASRSLEAATEQSMEAVMQKIAAAQNEPQGPTPEQIEAQQNAVIEEAKLQVEQFKVQAKTQLEQQKAFADAEIKQLRLAIEAKEASAEELLNVQKAQAEINLQREKLDLETRLKAAEIDAKMQLKQQEIVNRENLETIKILNTQKENAPAQSNGNGASVDSASGSISIDLKQAPEPPKRKVARFTTDPQGNRVAEIVEIPNG